MKSKKSLTMHLHIHEKVQQKGECRNLIDANNAEAS